MKKISVLLCLVTLLTVIFGGVQAADEPEYLETLTLAPSLGFLSMDVQETISTQSKSIFRMLFDTLIDYDPDAGHVVPSLALSWEQVSPTEWVFNLRDDVYFNNGTKFTAEDVKFTYLRGKEHSSSKGKLESIKDVEVIDETTVKIILNNPDADILYKLTELNLCILSKEAFETMDELDAYQVSTGAFMYDEWVEGDYLSIVRNDNYWGELPKTKHFIIADMSDASTRLIALQTGEVDMVMDPPFVDLHYVVEDPSLKLIQAAGVSCRYIGLNMNVEPFNNPLVRQAICYGINRDTMIQMVYEGNAAAAYNVMSPTMGVFYKEIEGYPYDPEKAKALLAEAGYPDGFSTIIYTGSGSIQKNVGAVFQAQMAEIGINVEVQSLEQATFNATVAPGQPFTTMVNGWAGYHVGPDNALRNHFYTGGNNNHFGFDDPYINEQLDKAISLQDEAERAEIYKDLQEYITMEAAFIPVAIEYANIAMRADMEGYRTPNTIYQDYRYLYVEVK